MPRPSQSVPLTINNRREKYTYGVYKKNHSRDSAHREKIRRRLANISDSRITGSAIKEVWE